jgi:small-conductance mechanosensitive channel/CRP-like cAMP-binding protein
MKPIASLEERLPLVIRRLAAPVLFAFLVLGGVALLAALGVSTIDVRQNRNYGALAVGIAWALVVTRLLDYLFFDVAFRLRRKAAAPALLRQLVGLLIFGICVAALFKLILPGVSLGAVFTTSAIITAVIGLALQDTLGNLFAGLALHLEKTVQVGDMIRHAETFGIVEELSWRAIKLRTVEGNLLLLPNSVAGRETLEIYPRPGPPIARILRVGLEYDASPERAREALRGAVTGLAGLAAQPEPVAYVKSFDASAVIYELRYWLEDYANYLEVDSRVHERVWYALSRAKLTIAYPVIRQHQYRAPNLETPDRRPAIAAAVDKAALFARLSEDQRRRLVEGSSERQYAPGETIVKEGDRSSSMFVIESGSVAVSIQGAMGEDRALTVLDAGAAFGEISLLTGEPRTATVRAVSETTLVEIEKESLAPILREHPQLVQALEATMVERRRHATGEFDASRGETGKTEEPLPLAERIARFFGL